MVLTFFSEPLAKTGGEVTSQLGNVEKLFFWGKLIRFSQKFRNSELLAARIVSRANFRPVFCGCADGRSPLFKTASHFQTFSAQFRNQHELYSTDGRGNRMQHSLVWRIRNNAVSGRNKLRAPFWSFNRPVLNSKEKRRTPVCGIRGRMGEWIRDHSLNARARLLIYGNATLRLIDDFQSRIPCFNGPRFLFLRIFRPRLPRFQISKPVGNEMNFSLVGELQTTSKSPKFFKTKKKKNQRVYQDTRWKWNFFEHSCAWECQSMYEPVCEIFLNFFKTAYGSYFYKL